MKLIEQVTNLKFEADEKYSKYKSLIEYLDQVNKQLPPNKKIRNGRFNIKIDYEQLTELYNEGQRQKNNVDNLLH